MQCVILAAGEGSRIARGVTSKPLVPVAGLPLIERTIATAHEAGLTQFIVVTGHEAHRLEPVLDEVRRRRKVSIVPLRCESWQAGNGASLLRAREAVRGPFILLMADHVVEPAIIERVMRERLHHAAVVLAVDRRVHGNAHVDPHDVTRVLVEDEQIRAIGKGLAHFNAFDTGVFLCDPTVFDTVDEGSHDGNGSLSGGVGKLAARGKARALDIGDAHWVDVDTPAARRQASALLYSSVTKPHDGWVSRRLNRPLSLRVITPLLLRAFPRITPNQVSLLGFAAALMAVLAFALRQPILAAIMVHFASVLDGSDGEIARLKKLQSSLGAFFDAVLDRYADVFILIGATFFVLTESRMAALFDTYLNPVVLATGALAIAGTLMVSYTSTKAQAELGHRYKGWGIATGSGRDWRLFVVFTGGLVAAVHPVALFAALALLAVTTNAIALWRLGLSWVRVRTTNPFVGRPCKAVIFDFDGTIADTMPYLTDLAVGLLTWNYAVSVQDARRRYLRTTGTTFAAQLEELFPGDPKNAHVADRFDREKRPGFLARPVFSDVPPVLRFLQDRAAPTFICSSTHVELVEAYGEHHGLEDETTATLGYEDGLTKDRQLARILREQQIEADEAVFVGDSLRDGRYARRLGIRFVGVRRTANEADFASAGLASVADLRSLPGMWRRARFLNSAVVRTG